MSNYVFTSRMTVSEELPEAEVNDIRTEPMLFKCNSEYAFHLGGRLTRLFMSALPEDWKTANLSIDSRSHMLMPGWYPCIPGWHHDDVPRTRADGQPNYASPEYKAEHIMALWGDASLTEFAQGNDEFPDVPLGSVYYREWHPLVERKIQQGRLRREIAPERRLLHFDWQTWHQGTPATKNGWRFFIRATRYSLAPVANEIRNQSQIYMPATLAGW